MITIDRIHTPALRTTLPEYIVRDYKIVLAVPMADRPGVYPAWTVLAHRASDDEYVVWQAIYNDDRNEWYAEAGNYFHPREGAGHDQRAWEWFWERARGFAWRP